MKKWLVFLVSLCLAALCVPALAASSRPTAYVDGGTVDQVHLRQKPASDARSLGLYFTGTEVECWSDPSETWVHVSIGAEDGYMMSKYLSLEEVPSRQPEGIAHTESWLNLRKLPTKDSQRLGTLHEGDKVTVLGETAYSWYYINANGVYGYVYERYLELGSAAEQPLAGEELPLLRAALGSVADRAIIPMYDWLGLGAAGAATADGAGLGRRRSDGSGGEGISPRRRGHRAWLTGAGRAARRGLRL